MEFEKQVKHIAIFHDEFFISSTLDNASSQSLYSYLIGCNEAQREDRSMKCLSYKEMSQNSHTVFRKKQEETKVVSKEINQSDFCRINPQNSFTFISSTIHGFVIGPHNFTEEGGPGNQSMCNYAPIVYFKNENTGKVECFRMMVYIGHKTMISLMFEESQIFDYEFLDKLDQHLAKHCPIISQLIDIAANKVIQPDDPCKFFYYNEGNMAVKISNLITKEIFNYELKLQLNQMHENFADDPDL